MPFAGAHTRLLLVITTATLRDATAWDEFVDDLGLAGPVRHGLRHTALTWIADAGVELHLLQHVAGHQDPPVTSVIFTRITKPCSIPGRRTRAGGHNLGPTSRR
jgi:integrase